MAGAGARRRDRHHLRRIRSGGTGRASRGPGQFHGGGRIQCRLPGPEKPERFGAGGPVASGGTADPEPDGRHSGSSEHTAVAPGTDRTTGTVGSRGGNDRFLPVGVPSRIRIADIGVDALVTAAGVDGTGALAIPDDVATVGWYRFGPRPGSPTGSAVLAGHVDERDQGVGALHRIGDLHRGAAIEITDAGGARRVFTVIAREEWHKQRVPLARLFDAAGAPRIVLITCGGAFDADLGSYRDNIAVTAVPLPR